MVQKMPKRFNFFFGCKYNVNDTIETLEREFQCQKWFLPTSDTLDLQEVWRYIGYSVVNPMRVVYEDKNSLYVWDISSYPH